LRHRYVDRIESFVKSLTQTQGAASDHIELQRQYKNDLKDDLAILKDELRLKRKDAFFSASVIVAALAIVGSIANQMLSVPFVLPDVVTLSGAAVTIGGLLTVRNKFLDSRLSILQKHPMAYLFEMRSSPLAML
jgi:hypothetical protein